MLFSQFMYDSSVIMLVET